MNNGCPECEKVSGYCPECEIEFLKWCITANRARIKELEQVQEQEQKGTSHEKL